VTPCQPTEAAPDCQGPFRWDRSQTVALLEETLDPEAPSSLRCFAAQHELPPSTLRHWKRRKGRLDAPEPVRDFFESKAGLDFLQRLVLAAHRHFHQSGACGIRPLTAFFRDAGRAPFLACSFGPQQRLARALQGLLIHYGREQSAKLAATMPRRKITLCEDENFHHGPPCLVAVEPVSNFILLEARSAKRDADSWDKAVGQALQGLPVGVVQGTSDEAKGILAHVRDGLGAHHSPDLMHLQQDLHQATSLPLQTQVKRAQEEALQAEYRAFLAAYAKVHWENGPRRGRPPALAAQLEPRKEEMRQAKQEVVRCEQSQQQVKQAIRGLGDDYHPFDAATGEALQPEALRTRLEGRLEVVEKEAEKAGVSDACEKKIRRVRKLLPQLVATLAWFWLQVRALGVEQGWSEGRQELLRGPVLAWAYWEQASRRGRDAAHKRRLRELAGRCRVRVEASAEWQGLSEQQRQRMEGLARECAGRWVRSSSCVEGRNGYLSLRHHGRRGLTAKELAVLTVLHNYGIVRPDATTAAERFFGQKPDDLFTWLRQRCPDLPRPAQPRRKKAA